MLLPKGLVVGRNSKLKDKSIAVYLNALDTDIFSCGHPHPAREQDVVALSIPALSDKNEAT